MPDMPTITVTPNPTASTFSVMGSGFATSGRGCCEYIAIYFDGVKITKAIKVHRTFSRSLTIPTGTVDGTYTIEAKTEPGGVLLASTTLTVVIGAPPPVPSGVYGSGVSGDSRNNHQIGWTNNAKLDYRFVASTTSAANTLRVQERGGPIYSGGTGGTIKAAIQADSGGLPSGVDLASLTWSPGNPAGQWEVWTLHTFGSPASLTSGNVYHLVFTNVHASPTTNWISLNMLFTYNGAANPAFPSDFATLYAQPTTWVEQTHDLPIFDLGYADSTHDGNGYIGNQATSYGNITGTTDLVREHFTISGGNKTVLAAHVRLRRISGTGALVVRLETGAGVLIEAVNVLASTIGIGIVPDPTPGGLDGDTWANATFLSSHLLTNGQIYNLRLSTDASTRYTAVPVQRGTSKGLLSRVFPDGDGQRSTDGGSTWANLYLYDGHDLQFYFDL